jgi:uncharacterized membrane protein
MSCHTTFYFTLALPLIAMVSLFFHFPHHNPYVALNFATFQIAVASNLMQMGWLILSTEDPTSAWCLYRHLLDHI